MRATILLFFAAVAAPRPGLAQQAQVNLEPAPHRNTDNLTPYGASVISPEVATDRRITFRLKAPAASSVLLAPSPLTLALGERKPVPFTKGDGGVWTLTVGPVKPNIYVYRLQVDGVSVADPNNTLSGFGNQPAFSEVVVPGEGPAYYDARPVPHGAVTRHIYHSDVTKGEREIYVYTPPGYAAGRRYPVLYLLGGSGELASGWLLYGRLDLILDNLIAEGKAQPMIVAMPNNQVLHRSHPQHAELTFTTFEAELRRQIVPFVDRHYRTRAERRGRALAGLSMGGRHTQTTGFACLDLFSSFGVLSAGDVDTEKTSATFFATPGVAKKVDYLLVGLGSHEQNPMGNLRPVEERSLALRDALARHKIPHEYYAGGDGGHDWGTWRHLLHAKLLPGLWR